MILENTKNMRVRDEVCAAEALAAAAQQQPDILVQDIDQCHLNYYDLFNELRSRVSKAQIVVLTTDSDEATFRNVYRSGVGAVVPKLRSADTLVSAIERVHSGKLWVDDSLLTSILAKIDPSRRKIHGEEHLSLIGRALEIVRLIGKGYRNKRIAEKLGISEATVRHHLTLIFGKLGVSDRIELLIFAHVNNLIELTLDR